jgi:hypothetical protein
VSTFAQSSLPDSAKEALCRSLLAEFGVDRIQATHGGELRCCCPMPWHDEKHPSASLNYRKLTFNCLQADTLVKTYDGEFPIQDLAGGHHMLLDGNGKWVKAYVRDFGQDRLYRVTLSRNGVKREIYTTLNHRWYVRKQGSYEKGKGVDLVEKTTADLKPKDRIPSVWPMVRTGRTTLSPVGVMAGFVFGDGSRTEYSAVANFYGEKDKALLPYFAGHKVHTYEGVQKIVSGLPRSWKSLPSLDEGHGYLYGWLAGYFAADGCVADDGHVTLACADESTLRFVVAVCDRLGIATYTLSGRQRVGKGDGPSAIYSLSFRVSTMKPEFFLIPAHRERFERGLETRKYDRTHWWVSSVEETDRYETVYCAEVPTTHSFVLADNILTGNCLGCQSSGGLLWFIATCRGEPARQARDWLDGSTGFGSEVDVPALLNLLEAIFDGSKQAREPIPKMSMRILTPWRFLHPYLTDPPLPDGKGGRGIPVDNLIRMNVGYAPEYQIGEHQTSERVIIPHVWKGSLTGWQSRRLCDDGTPKYLSTEGMPKDRTIYNYDPDAEAVVVVESPMSALRHLHHLPIEATFGANVTDHQVKLLARHERIILFMDNDKAGWRSVEGHYEVKKGRPPKEISKGLIERLEPYSQVKVVDNPWAADPGDMDEETAWDLVRTAVPSSLWKRPQAKLMEWKVK